MLDKKLVLHIDLITSHHCSSAALTGTGPARRAAGSGEALQAPVPQQPAARTGSGPLPPPAPQAGAPRRPSYPSYSPQQPRRPPPSPFNGAGARHTLYQLSCHIPFAREVSWCNLASQGVLPAFSTE